MCLLGSDHGGEREKVAICMGLFYKPIARTRTLWQRKEQQENVEPWDGDKKVTRADDKRIQKFFFFFNKHKDSHGVKHNISMNTIIFF